MAYTPTTNLSLPIITTGTESGTWGDVVDNGLTSYLDIAIAGGLAIAITTADVTLTKTAGTNATTGIVSTTAQYAILNISGAKTAARNLNLPITSKSYMINNAGTGGFLLTVRGVTPTTGVTLVDGESAVVAWNGTDFTKIATNLAGVPSINGGQLAGLRNRIINGSTTVSQRGTAFTPTLGTIYTVDRWYLYTSGAAQATVQPQLGGGPNAINPNFMTAIGAAGNTASNFGQRIEAVNSADMSGQIVTLSAWVYTSDTRLVTLALNYANAVDNFATTTSITATSTTSVSATGWRYVTSKFTVPSTQNGLEVGITFGAVAASIQVAFTGAQLEIGSTATTFEQRPIGMELGLCKRYYEVIGNTAGDVQLIQGAYATGVNIGTWLSWKEVKRVSPSVTISGTWTVSSCGQPTISSTGINGAHLTALSDSANGQVSILSTASTAITASAEL